MVQKTLKVSGLGLVLKNIQIGNPLPSTLFRFYDLQQNAVSLLLSGKFYKDFK